MSRVIGHSVRGDTYTVQMEGVRCAGGAPGAHGERDLNGRVGRQRVVAASGQEVGRGNAAREDLEEGGDGGRDECDVIDEELGAVLPV